MIKLDCIKPEPLKESKVNYTSQTWGVELKFEKGKRYLVTAPSGKGKSTLVHILYGLRNDYEGSFSINDRKANDLNLDDWSDIRQDKISIVFQNLRLFEQMTVMENLLLKSSLKNHKNESEIQTMAMHLGIDELLTKQCGKLSYGQRQRVAIIRALCQPFDFLLLDEPFSHLDKENIKKASTLIEDACEDQGAGMILVSLGDKYFFDYDKELIL